MHSFRLIKFMFIIYAYEDDSNDNEDDVGADREIAHHNPTTLYGKAYLTACFSPLASSWYPSHTAAAAAVLPICCIGVCFETITEQKCFLVFISYKVSFAFA